MRLAFNPKHTVPSYRAKKQYSKLVLMFSSLFVLVLFASVLFWLYIKIIDISYLYSAIFILLASGFFFITRGPSLAQLVFLFSAFGIEFALLQNPHVLESIDIFQFHLPLEFFMLLFVVLDLFLIINMFMINIAFTDVRELNKKD